MTSSDKEKTTEGCYKAFVGSDSTEKECDAKDFYYLGRPQNEESENTQDSTHRCRFATRENRDIARREFLERINVLAGGLAHQLNAPLATVIHNFDDLVDAVELIDSERHTERIKIVNDGLLQIKEIVDGLNSFSCMAEENVSDVDLNCAIERAIRLTTEQTSGHAFVSQELGNLPRLVGSSDKLVQVFVNLITNACDSFGKSTDIDNHILIRTWSDANDVWAEVADTGCGIPRINLENIFEPFFTTRWSEHKCGLGLAIARRIVSGIGGEIRVESREGQGSLFLTRIPFHNLLATDLKRLSPVLCGRILVIDDDSLIREVVVSMLENKFEIVAVDSARLAQDVLYSDLRFDLVLCDIMMPEITGIEFHEWLVDNHPALSRRLVFMTGGVFGYRTNDYIERVGNIIIKKPFSRKSLLNIVGEQIHVFQSIVD